jgi:hypothetical protein
MPLLLTKIISYFLKFFFFWVDAKPLLWFGIAIGDVINGVITTLNYNHTN